MSDIKIPSGPPAPREPESISETTASQADPEVNAVQPGAEDPVGKIAEDLAAGRIDRERAIDLMIEHTLDSRMVAAAPEGLRDELAAVLDSAIRTDPHLRALARGMGIAEE